jgi:3-oxoacyl-[acyl-carrier protein] reductase
VLVVGAGSGIGAGIAGLLGEAGMTVVCVDREAAAAASVAGAIEDGGGRAFAIPADISDEHSVEQCFDDAGRAVGQLHAVVNSAGVQGALGVRTDEVEVEAFDATYAVNLRGAFLVSRAAVRRMLSFGYGRIVHIASIAGKEGNPNMVCYSATKAGLIGLVKAQGKEYAEDGITVNAIAPAVIQTPFLDTQPAEVIDYMTSRIPMRRTGTVAEVASLVAFVISPECGFTTGFTFDLSGGRATY